MLFSDILTLIIQHFSQIDEALFKYIIEAPIFMCYNLLITTISIKFDGVIMDFVQCLYLGHIPMGRNLLRNDVVPIVTYNSTCTYELR